MKVGYFSKGGSKRNDSGLVVLYDCFNIPRRNLEPKGILFTPLHWREATEEEIKLEYEPHWRVEFILYQRFEGLWNDELKYCDDTKHLEALLKIRKENKDLFIDHNFEVNTDQLHRMGGNRGVLVPDADLKGLGIDIIVNNLIEIPR